jgi:hypothetical protein
MKVKGNHHGEIDEVPEGEYESEYCEWCHIICMIFVFNFNFHTDKPRRIKSCKSDCDCKVTEFLVNGEKNALSEG